MFREYKAHILYKISSELPAHNEYLEPRVLLLEKAER